MRDEAQIHQDLAKLVAALALQFQRAVEVFLGDLPTLNEISPSRMYYFSAQSA